MRLLAAALAALNVISAVVVAAARSTSQATLMNIISLAASFVALGISAFVLYKFKTERLDPVTERVNLLVNSQPEAPEDREA